MQPHDEALQVDQLTWAALLGRWLDFARASVALPRDAEGQRWKASVAPVITLQAITFALGQLSDLAEDERALGLDRAELLLRQESGRLNQTWRGEPMPPLLLELMNDAAGALRAAMLGCCIEWLVPDDESEPREIDDYRPALQRLAGADFDGSLHLAWPGTLLIAGEPVGFAAGPDVRCCWRRQINAADATRTSLRELVEAIAPLRARYVAAPRQVYRSVDEQGRIIEDAAAPLTGDPLPGQPLLHRVFDRGDVQSPTIDASRWIAQQRAAWPADGLRFKTDDSSPRSERATRKPEPRP